MDLSALDFRTLVVGQIVLTLIYAVVFFLLSRAYPYIAGLRTLSVAFGIGVTARLAYMVDLRYSPSLGDMLAVAATAGFYFAIRDYLGEGRPRLIWILCAIPVWLELFKNLTAWHTFAVISQLTVGTTMFLLRLLCALALLRCQGHKKVVRMFSLFMAMYALFSLVLLAGTRVGFQHCIFYLFHCRWQTVSLLLNVVFSSLLGLFFLVMMGGFLLHQSEQRALLDALTGALNRRGIRHKLNAEVVMAAENNYHFCVGMVDLDNFKSINDNLGHAEGDTALLRVVKVARTHLRPYDALGRYGGDEFLLLFAACNLDTAIVLARAICQQVRDSRQPGEPLVTISIGLTQYEKCDSVESLISKADRALQRAKRMGKGRVEVETHIVSQSIPGTSFPGWGLLR